MNLLSRITQRLIRFKVHHAGRRYERRLLEATADPEGARRKTLLRILGAQAEAEFGKRRGFAVAFALAVALLLSSLAARAQTSVRSVNGMPTLVRDGEPQAPIILFGQEIPAHYGRDFREAGFEYFSSIHKASFLDLGWRYDPAANTSTFDLSTFDQVRDDFFAHSPAASWFPRIHLYAPEAWLNDTSGPGGADLTQERVGYAIQPSELRYRTEVSDEWRQAAVVESFASEKWRAEVDAGLRKLVASIGSDRRIPGLVLAAGMGGEWHPYTSHFLPDTGPAMERYFRAFLRARYAGDVSALRAAWGSPMVTFETATIPTAADRHAVFDGIFQDPRRRSVRDYYDAYHDSVTTAIQRFARTVKDASGGRLLIFVLYGYAPETPYNPKEFHHGDHARAYALADVDGFASPHSYWHRGLGQHAELRSYAQSIARRGKLFIDEADERTHLTRLLQDTCDFPYGRHANTPENTLSVLQRSFANVITQGVGVWFMDQTGDGTWYEEDCTDKCSAQCGAWPETLTKCTEQRLTELRKKIWIPCSPSSDMQVCGYQCAQVCKESARAIYHQFSDIKRWADFSMKVPRTRRSEVAAVSCPRSELYLGTRKDLSAQIYVAQTEALRQAGAPYDHVLIDDLEHGLMPEYKAYLFLDCFYLTDAQKAAIDRLKTNQHTLVWFYAPGYATDAGLSLASMQAVTGISFKRDLWPYSSMSVDRCVGGSSVSLFRPEFEPPQDCLEDPLGCNAPQQLSPRFTPQSSGQEVLGYHAGSCSSEQGPAAAYVSRPMGAWTSVYSAVPYLPEAQLRRIYAQSGVHVYASSNDPLGANERWLTLHAASKGIKSVSLPSETPVYDVLKNRWVSMGATRSFQHSMDHGETALFYLGDPLASHADAWGWGGKNRFLVMDFDGDRRDDLVTRHADGAMTVWRSTGTTFTWHAAFQTPYADAAGWDARDNAFFVMKLDNDTRDDLVVRQKDGLLRSWRSTGSALAELPPLQTGYKDAWGWGGGNRFFVMDVDGAVGPDGVRKPELLARFSSGAIAIWKSNDTTSNPQLAYYADFPMPGYDDAGWLHGNRFVPMDVNRDRRADLLARDRLGNMNVWTSVLRSDGKWVLAPSRAFSTPHKDDGGWLEGSHFLPATLNGDGVQDLLLARRDSGDFDVWRADGSALSAAPAFRTLLGTDFRWDEPNRLFVMDLDGDGSDDLVARRPEGLFQLYRFDGAKLVFQRDFRDR